MIFTETELDGIYIIDIEKKEDDRGFFARSWCVNEFQEQGLDCEIKQCNISYNKNAGTVRGLHYQKAPYDEVKIVRCTRGKIFDVVVDIRKSSSTYLHWFGINLNSESCRMLYISKGFAHGFQTLVDSCEVYYQMSNIYNPVASRGLRWNDPDIGIKWPMDSPDMSERDKQFPLLSSAGK